MKKGDIVSLKVPCLGNPIGTFGVVYDTYEDYDEPDEIGVCIIFANGEYSGFSFSEQTDFLDLCGFDRTASLYKFSHVMQLSRDYQAHMFDSVFK